MRIDDYARRVELGEKDATISKLIDIIENLSKRLAKDKQ